MYPLFAQAERIAFEMIWKNHQKTSCMSRASEVCSKQCNTAPHISLRTRLLSTLREKILNRRMIVALASLAMLTGLITLGLYENIVQMNRARVLDKAVAAAATGALQFSAEEVEELQKPSDINKPVYESVVQKLDRIRKQNTRIMYVYIMRPTDDPNFFAFVADADSLNPFETRDVNGDGVINQADHLSPPGELYDVSEYIEVAKHSLIEPYGSTTIYEDLWGSYIAGWAPIKDESGKTVAVLGTDIRADDAERLSAESFPPLILFLGFFTLLLLVSAVTAAYFHRLERSTHR